VKVGDKYGVGVAKFTLDVQALNLQATLQTKSRRTGSGSAKVRL
jgi:hypothetical protein